MDLRYSLTPGDVDAAWRGHRPFFVGEMLASASLALAGVALLTVDAASPFAWLATVVGVLLVARGQWSRQRRRWHGPAESLPVHLTVSEDGLTARTPDATTRVAWAAYTDSHEIPAGFLLYRGGTYSFIPRRAFTSGEDVDAFRGIVGRRVERRRWIRIRRKARRMTAR